MILGNPGDAVRETKALPSKLVISSDYCGIDLVLIKFQNFKIIQYFFKLEIYIHQANRHFTLKGYFAN